MTTLIRRYRNGEKGAIGYVLLWLLGIPIPVLLVIFLLAAVPESLREAGPRRRALDGSGALWQEGRCDGSVAR